MPPRQVTYMGAMLGVQRLPDGQRALVAMIPGVEAHVFPLDDRSCRALAGQLAGGLEIA